jgi:hypothetical protein
MIKKTLLALVLVLFCGCTVSGVDIEQENAASLAGELLDGHTFGQTFKPTYNGLYRVDLYTATYARTNTHPVIFRVRVSPSPGTNQTELPDLVRVEIPASQISNSGPTIITFPRLPDTAGLSLYFSIESPGSVPGDAITVYRNEQDVYPGGQMLVDGQPTAGDLAFIAYTEETFTIGDIWNDFYSRAGQDKSFFIFYCVLILLILLALIGVLIWFACKPTKEKLNRSDEPPTGSSDSITKEAD